MSMVTEFLYKYFLKPVLFLFPADNIHELFLRFGAVLSGSAIARNIIARLWRYQHPSLTQTIAGLSFNNPVGLAAGFDYNADLVGILSSVGFGFHTVGSLTHKPYDGNPRPMLQRLPRSRSLLVNKGFRNKGIENVLSTMRETCDVPRGVSIGATNMPYAHFDEMLDDIIAGFQVAERFNNFDYYELNISCPNLHNIQNLGEQFSSVSGLTKLLLRLQKLGIHRPLFIKMPLEKTNEDVSGLMRVAEPFLFVTGLIFANLAKDRTNPLFDAHEIAHAATGNFSGKPLEQKANDLLKYAYTAYGSRFVLIGVGGIFTAEDAYQKILCGASLVQLITGMVYGGPQQIGAINEGIVQLLLRDGYQNISEAVGAFTRVRA